MYEFKSVDESYLDALMNVELACHSFPWSRNTMKSCIGGRYFNLAVFDGETLIAFYVGEQAGPDYTLMDICVHPTWQRRGIAKQLLTHFIDTCTARDAENVFLEVRASNKNAIHLYEQAGFIEMGIRKNYYPTANGNEDAILMGMSFFGEFGI
ncbi:ribosomal protein S18-alanine N-acetyltransferase [Pseudoalteromonas xiamenensis]|uniref:ribosomal protein S18-alanine N-acetyltransferase n=1 Tax=Pseudoalteromonas xiamenensis TaxID=882626 RepID=UPI0035E86D5D